MKITSSAVPALADIVVDINKLDQMCQQIILFFKKISPDQIFLKVIFEIL